MISGWRHLTMLPVAAGFFAVLLPAAQSQAGFTLLEERRERDGYTAIVSFSPDWALAEAASADRRILLPEGFDAPELFAEEIPPRNIADFATSSFILGLPGHREITPAQWHVEALSATLPDGTTIEEFDVDSSITVLPATVGTVRGVQILVDPTIALAGERPVELTIQVSGPGGAGLPKGVTGRLTEREASAVTSLFLNRVSSSDVPTTLVDPAVKDTVPFPMPPGEFRLGYKDGERVFRLPLEELGLTAADVPNLTLKHHPELLPVEDFDPDDPQYEEHEILLSIGGNAEDGFWFYAPRRNTLSDRTDSVFVSLSDEAKSPLVQTREAFPATGDPEDIVSPPSEEQPDWREQVFEYRNVYQRAMPTPIGERFAAFTISQGATRTVTMPLPGELTDLSMTMTPVVVGVTVAPPHDPDHYADFTLEGVALPRTSWKGRTVHRPEFPVTLAAAPEDGILTLEHEVPTGTPPVSDGFADIQNLMDVELRYESLPRVGDSTAYILELPEDEVQSPKALTVGGFAAGTSLEDIVVLDITSARAPIKLTGLHGFVGSDGELAVAFAAQEGRTRYFVGIRESVTNPPTVTESEMLTPLTGPETRLGSIFVRESSLAAALTPLVQAHAGGTIELLPQAAFNAFNGGQESPEAIRDALSYYILNAPDRVPFPYVLLVGHGTLDPRDYLGLQHGAQIPVYREPSPPSGGIRIETPVDMPYSRFFSDSVLLSGVVARLPVRTPEELEIIINRQFAYNAAAPELSTKGRAGVFMNDYPAEIIADGALWPDLWEATGKPSTRIDFPSGSNGTAQRAELADILTDQDSGGAAYVLYMGHGNNDRWGSNGNLLRTSHVSSFDTEGRWPIVTTFTCLSAYFAFPTPQFGVSMAETWILTPEGGAIGTMAPASIDFYTEQKLFAMAQMGVLGDEESERPESWGGIFTEGANRYLTSFPGLQRSAANFHYFGDPSAHATLSEIPENAGLNGWALW